MTLEDARRVIAAAEKKSKEIGQPMNIAVADEGGNLVSHVRIDGAGLSSIDLSIKKAYTSRAFDITTKDLGANSQSGDQVFGIHASNDGKVMIFPGGIPLKKDGKTVGATGISGRDSMAFETIETDDATAACNGGGGPMGTKPYGPSFRSTAARRTLPAVGASTCASGSQVWSGKSGGSVASAPPAGGRASDGAPALPAPHSPLPRRDAPPPLLRAALPRPGPV